MITLLTNPDLISSLLGFIGTVLIFFLGLPPRIDRDGAIHLIAEQTDVNEKKMAAYYKLASYSGLILLALSLLVQVTKIVVTVT